MFQNLFALLLLTVFTTAATFTVFDVFPTADDGSTGDPLTINLRPLGVGSDGATTYEFAEPIDASETARATVVADATHLHLVAATPYSLVRDCSWKDTSGAGVCSVFGEGIPGTQAFTGRVAPLFTLTVSEGDSATSGPTRDANSPQGTPTSSAAPAGQTNSAIKLGAAVGFGSIVPTLLRSDRTLCALRIRKNQQPSGATITVFDVFPTAADGTTGPEVNISLIPIGVGSDGATTYALAEFDPTRTFRDTIVEDATHIHLPAPSPFIRRDCSWEGTSGEGVCSFFDGVQASTYTGIVTPIFTLTADDPSSSGDVPSLQATPTSNPPDNQSNSAKKLSRVLSFVTVFTLSLLF
ncbi:hypothetical protein EYR40_002135 [Pleurotus pulmonarius]|nr:hypothetical protein EYR40_002135 [Pleurotus pulmonarius]